MVSPVLFWLAGAHTTVMIKQVTVMVNSLDDDHCYAKSISSHG